MNANVLTALELIALLCCGVFTGAAVYINFVEHPARNEGGPAFALKEWAPSYRRATLMQAPLALIGGLAALTAWIGGAGRAWLVAGLLLLSVVPVTLLVIMPTNRALLAPETGNDLTRVAALLARWNRLHAVRSVLSAAAFLILAWSLVQPRP
jgi:uncharacterized membrane protein